MNKRFDGGVTTIQSHALKENLLAVGRYALQPACQTVAHAGQL